jgi:hypothetical protein
VHIYVDGAVVAGLTANQHRPDVGAAYPGSGDYHGFSDIVANGIAAGDHTVCTYAINVGPGDTNPLLSTCKTVTITPRNPFGFLDGATPSGAGIHVRGWAIDPNTTEPINVHIYVDGAVVAGLTANQHRPDVGAAHPGFGDYHGFDDVVANGIAAGDHTVCAYAINVGAGEGNPLLPTCKTLTTGT